MLIEQFRWLAGTIAAHKNRRAPGRPRLQWTIYLLQRKGLPTDFQYSLFFGGPYSEGLQVGLRLVKQLGFVTEKRQGEGENGNAIFEAAEDAVLPEVAPYQRDLDLIQQTPDIPLELAVAYEGFRQLGYGHTQAVERLRRKKKARWTAKGEAAALALLRRLELPVDE
jgi:hypothetical protein